MVEQTKNSELTDAEAELYDRQIRLWGLESQKRLRAASVLIVGLNGYTAEVAKNIILAGVKSVTFLDHRLVTPQDFCAQFFLSRDQIGKNRAEASVQRAQNLNPMVEVKADPRNVDELSDEFFEHFDVVCITECTIQQINKINSICRKFNKKFFTGDVWGTFGYTFADLMTHEFAEDVIQTKRKLTLEAGDTVQKEKFEKITITVKKTDNYVTFEEAMKLKVPPKESTAYYLLKILLNFREKHKRDPLPHERSQNILNDEARAIIEEYNLENKMDNLVNGDVYAQISPVCAILGGVMGQEIIKTVSQKEQPHNNLFLFDPETMGGQVFRLR